MRTSLIILLSCNKQAQSSIKFNMLRIIALIVCVAASAQAGVLAGHSYASSPALGAPLVGSVTYKAPEVTVVKQPVVVDQPEIRYRAVPTVVRTAPIVKTIAPAVTYAAAPAPVVKTVAAAPAVTYAAAPAPVVKTVAAAPAVTYAAAPAPVIKTVAAAPAVTYAAAAPAYTYAAAAPYYSYGAVPAYTTYAGHYATYYKK